MSGRFQRGLGSFAEQRRWKQHVPWALTGPPTTGVVAPPFDNAHNVWTFDPDGTGAQQYVAGPTGTPTTPTQTIGTPSFYTFGAADFIDFGDSLDSTWTLSTGWTIYVSIKPSAGDLALANQPVVNKMGTGGTNEAIDVLLSSNQVVLTTYYGGAVANFDLYKSAAALVAGTRYVVALTYNPALGRTSRGVIYLNGSASSGAGTGSTGSDGVIADSTGPLRLGKPSYSAVAPTSVSSYASAYNAVHSAGTVASITNWYQTTKGWA